ncbi:MAG: hypothetical protein CMH64_03090 [Nanoarchaeota archaeon]|jgi:hypothetical protein|nr:hypothetical protein [Nanoarchaeota archaeon]|tara:strand:+ start:290 stop:616 length:327 start_codon:yes stop_codon:yes gene_type:complete
MNKIIDTVNELKSLKVKHKIIFKDNAKNEMHSFFKNNDECIIIALSENSIIIHQYEKENAKCEMNHYFTEIELKHKSLAKAMFLELINLDFENITLDKYENYNIGHIL